MRTLFKNSTIIFLLVLTTNRRAGDAGEDVLDDILGPDFKKYHTLKKTVRGCLFR